jgi:uncharacterized membrane protein
MQTSDKSRSLIAGAVASVLALGLMAVSQMAAAAAAEMEKCTGVAAAGKNDCGTATSACAGTSKQDRQANTWILVPKGTCAKIAGGTVTTDPANKHGGGAAK